jgi:hypothetical protein
MEVPADLESSGASAFGFPAPKQPKLRGWFDAKLGPWLATGVIHIA